MSLNPGIVHQKPSSVELHHQEDSYDAFEHISPFQVEVKKNFQHSRLVVDLEDLVDHVERLVWEDQEEQMEDQEDLEVGLVESDLVLKEEKD